ncbi:golgin subfamily A member 6-like protein 22 [Temnothorax curvispinosus]|uniref:Golgin subfamily A member 6-like protein 22 n=1 Tax=Temnothorax curvispinosus TaxID=300111 RepID=A0A6J1PNN9_9HYME|nr:golgin subfamily A member 6-like protein 22 [Temnothorax curvispinosus]
MYRRWRNGKIGRDRYIEEKGKLGDLQLKKQEEKRRKEEEELRKLRKEAEVWKFINKKRNKKVWMENNIDKNEWRRHFMELLKETKVDKEDESRKSTRQQEEKGEEEDEITEMEIKMALNKDKKAGADGFDETNMERRKDILGLEEKHNSAIIQERRSREEGNYRGISLLCTAYKVYAEVLRSRLEMESEEKGMVPENQTGFRKGRSTINNIFVLNHLIQKERRKGDKVEKVYALFADLKAAFDNVDREILWKILREKGIKEQLIRRLEIIYEETEVVVRTSHGYTEEFQTSKGVTQGSVMSPLLFNLYTADLAESVMAYGVEIWGWEEKVELEKIMMDYIR